MKPDHKFITPSHRINYLVGSRIVSSTLLSPPDERQFKDCLSLTAMTSFIAHLDQNLRDREHQTFSQDVYRPRPFNIATLVAYILHYNSVQCLTRSILRCGLRSAYIVRVLTEANSWWATGLSSNDSCGQLAHNTWPQHVIKSRAIADAAVWSDMAQTDRRWVMRECVLKIMLPSY